MSLTYKKKKIKIMWLFLLALIVAVALLRPVRLITKKLYPLEYEEYIYSCAQQCSLDPYLVMGVISAESKFDAEARSKKDAMGLMQITQPTYNWIINKFHTDATEKDIFDPYANIMAGCIYLEYLTDTYDGNVQNALAAYNAGMGNVNAWLRDSAVSPDGKTLKNIPYPETERYIKTVEKRRNIYKKLY